MGLNPMHKESNWGNLDLNHSLVDFFLHGFFFFVEFAKISDLVGIIESWQKPMIKAEKTKAFNDKRKNWKKFGFFLDSDSLKIQI